MTVVVAELVEALADLCEAIDGNIQRRTLLSIVPGERRVEAIVLARQVLPAYERARAVLARADGR